MALSAFEARRRANVANNQKLLQDTAEIGTKMRRAAKPPPKPVAPRKRRAVAEPVQQRVRVQPSRQSARLSGTEAKHVELKDEFKETSVEFQPRKKARTSGDLSVSNLLLDGGRWANDSGALVSFAQGAQPGVRTFDEDVKDEADDEVNALRKTMGDLELYDGWLPNGETLPAIVGFICY
jgi:WD repeat-containing protein 76